MMSTRIAASKSHEFHWLVDSRSRYPVVVRAFDQSGKTLFRIEEYAKQAVPVYVSARRERRTAA